MWIIWLNEVTRHQSLEPSKHSSTTQFTVHWCIGKPRENPVTTRFLTIQIQVFKGVQASVMWGKFYITYIYWFCLFCPTTMVHKSKYLFCNKTRKHSEAVWEGRASGPEQSNQQHNFIYFYCRNKWLKILNMDKCLCLQLLKPTCCKRWLDLSLLMIIYCYGRMTSSRLKLSFHVHLFAWRKLLRRPFFKKHECLPECCGSVTELLFIVYPC